MEARRGAVQAQHGAEKKPAERIAWTALHLLLSQNSMSDNRLLKGTVGTGSAEEGRACLHVLAGDHQESVSDHPC